MFCSNPGANRDDKDLNLECPKDRNLSKVSLSVEEVHLGS